MAVTVKKSQENTWREMLSAQLRARLHNSSHALALLRQADLLTVSTEYERKKVIVSQGSPADTLFFLQEGIVKITIVSTRGKEAVIGILPSGSFFGESCLAGREAYPSSVEALATAVVIPIKRDRVLSAIYKHSELAEFLLAHVIQRHLDTQEDLAWQLFTSSERRLARILVRMAEIGENVEGGIVLPSISQETLAQMVGTTRSRINVFLKKLRRQGLIHYDKGLRIHFSLAAFQKRNPAP